MIIYDFEYIIFMIPAFAITFLAQMWVKSAYTSASRVQAGLTGYDAARQILDQAGLHNVSIEQVAGRMTDHYDPRHQVLRLSHDVYHGHSAAAIGIAAHEAGHALQDAKNYAPLAIRNIAVPMANFGSSIGLSMAMFGVLFNIGFLLLAGIVVFSGVVFFQLVNLPVEFDASSRAKRLLVEMNLAGPNEMTAVRRVLTAAAMTYVAVTIQAVMTLLYYILRYTSSRD